MKNRWTFSIIFVIIISSIAAIFLGININFNKNPKTVYAVYLDGNIIGSVSSKEEFNEFVNNKEEELKKKYNVDKIYTPNGVEIKKTITFSSKVNGNEEIYNELVSKKNFTIKGIVVTIDYKEEEKEDKIIYVLNKKIFDDSVKELVKAFVDEKQYNKFLNSTQDEITDTGEIIENVYIKDDITYRREYIPTNEMIFTNSSDLTRYLLYGTLEKQDTYVVKEGDTISDVANLHKLNVREFLIANPEFTSENNLLYESQEVTVGLINPIINIVEEIYSVKEEPHAYTTDIKYDSNLVVGYSYTEREGENGLDKVTRIYQYINGQPYDVALVTSVEVKPAVSKILVKGDKYIPNVADLSYWAWPTQKPYTITSYYQYRWGSFHAAIDIYVGHGSAIYAANNGTVYAVGNNCIRGDASCNNQRGNYIIINHNIANYYTQYMHLDSVLVRPGQTVSRGQKIATMGNTGYVVPSPGYGSSSVAGTHLDFGVWKGVPFAGGYHMNPLGLY